MYLLFGLNLITALMASFGIVMLLPLLHSLDDGGDEKASVASALLTNTLAELGVTSSVAILGVIGTIFLAKGAVTFMAESYAGFLQAQLMREIKTRLFDAYSRMDFRYFARRDTGHFTNVINLQVSNFYLAFRSIMSLFAGAVLSFSYFGFAMLIAWQFGLMALGVGLGLLLLFKRLNLYVRGLSRRTASENGHLTNLLIQTLHAFKYLTATQQTGHLRTGILGSIQRLTDYQVRQEVARAFTSAIQEPLSAVFIIAIVIVQLVVLNESLTPIMVAILLFHRGLNAVLGLQTQWQYALHLIGSVEIVRDEFEAQAEHCESDGEQEIGPLQHAIEFRDVTFAYDPKSGSVLNEITLGIRACTTVALVGESGAGKSTLVDMLVLLLKPDQGTLLIDGVPYNEIRLASWRKQIGYVSQDTVMFDDNLANNICLWMGDVTRDEVLLKRIKDAARRAHIAHFIESLPEGYLTNVGDRGIRLSGGQKQRLFIARELFKQPRLLILDEATSALDSESEHYIQQSIDALRGQMAVVIIAHRLATIRNVDHVFVFDTGRLIEQGSYEELRACKGSRLAAMVELQSL